MAQDNVLRVISATFTILSGRSASLQVIAGWVGTPFVASVMLLFSGHAQSPYPVLFYAIIAQPRRAMYSRMRFFSA